MLSARAGARVLIDNGSTTPGGMREGRIVGALAPAGEGSISPLSVRHETETRMWNDAHARAACVVSATSP